MRRWTRPLLVLLAIIFLIEAWLWSHLKPIVERIVAWIPLRAVKARIAGMIRSLSPAATLVVFIVPVIALLPLKFVGLWLLAHKHWLAAALLIVFAKLVGLAITAFVFEMTRPKLLKLGWFRWLYEHVLAWLDWAHALVDPIKRRIKARMKLLRPGQAGRTLRLMWRIRRRMRAERRASRPGYAVTSGAPRAAPTAQAP
jgi:hypothetical protein